MTDTKWEKQIAIQLERVQASAKRCETIKQNIDYLQEDLDAERTYLAGASENLAILESVTLKLAKIRGDS